MEVFEIALVAWALLFLGDFLSTFIYHIPEHVFGRLHLTTHHSPRKTFRYYAILIPDFWVLMDGLLGALPYFAVSTLLWPYSPTGVIVGLLLGQFHVWWRHVSALGWQTPQPIDLICQVLWITTPERHWLHHRNTHVGYGDIFTFFEQPAILWLRWLRFLRIHLQV